MSSAREVIRQLVAPVYLPVVAASIAWGMLVPVLPLYLTAEGISLDLAGLILGAAGIGAALGGLPAGALIAKRSENEIMIVSILVIAASTALLGVTHAVLALIALRAAFGAGLSAMRLSRQTYVTRRVRTNVRGRALANIGGASRAAHLIGPILGGVLVDVAGFEAAFAVAGALTLAGLVPLLQSRGGSLPVMTGLNERSSGSLLRALRPHWKLLLRIGVVPVLVVAGREGRQVVLPLIGDDLELSATAVGGLVAISAAADLTLFPVSGFLMDRFGRLWGMIPSFMLMAIGLFALALAWAADSVLLVILAGVLVGIGNGLGAGCLLTLGSDVAPPEATSEFLAGIATIQESGRVIGPLIVGIVGSAFSLGASSAAIGALLVFATVWLAFVIGETSTQPTPAKAPH